jgi:hypothetical protein
MGQMGNKKNVLRWKNYTLMKLDESKQLHKLQQQQFGTFKSSFTPTF